MESNTQGTPLPDLSGILSKIMSNPEAMTMLSSLLGNQSTKSAPKEKKENEREPAIASILPPTPAKASPREERRRLLLALKPFLSKERCEAIDRILMITDALSLLQTEKKV